MLLLRGCVEAICRGLKDLMSRGDNIKVIGWNDIKYSRLSAKIDILSLLFIITTSYCCTIYSP